MKVQEPPASGSNRVVFGGVEERPRGFLSYSACGTVKVRRCEPPAVSS